MKITKKRGIKEVYDKLKRKRGLCICDLGGIVRSGFDGQPYRHQFYVSSVSSSLPVMKMETIRIWYLSYISDPDRLVAIEIKYPKQENPDDEESLRQSMIYEFGSRGDIALNLVPYDPEKV